MTSPALARRAREGEPGYEWGGRVYEHPVTHRVVPSITAVEAALAKPAIPYWAARQAAEFVADNLETLSKVEDGENAITGKKVTAREQIVDHVRKAPWNKSGKSANDGDVIHDAIDVFIKTGKAPALDVFGSWSVTAKRMWKSFTDFNEQMRPEWVESEFTVWSDTHEYAGTGDWIARIGKWLVLGDTKTGKSTYPEVGMQLAALAHADYIIEADGKQRDIPVFDRFAVLHIRPTFADLVQVNHIPQAFVAFAALRNVRRWQDKWGKETLGGVARVDSPIGKAA